MLDRRRFAYTLMGFVAFGSGPWSFATAAAQAWGSLEGPLSRGVFLALEREPFSLLLDNREAGLFLLKVDDLESGPESDQFTLVFQAPRELMLLDGVYRISHITAGTTEVFLQPAGNDRRYNYYHAYFNLLHPGVQAAPPERKGGRGWRFVP